jgi:hypothetical protein
MAKMRNCALYLYAEMEMATCGKCMKTFLIILMVYWTVSSEPPDRWIPFFGQIFAFNSDIQPIVESKIKNHICIFQKLYTYSNFFKNKNLGIKDSLKDTIRISLDSNEKRTVYDNLWRYGISTISIDEAGVAREIRFNESSVRGMTPEERRIQDSTRKMPASFAVINAEQACGRAQSLLILCLGVDESNKFDSVFVDESTEAYRVVFTIKRKKNVDDNRVAYVTINPRSGEIEQYSGPGKTAVD